MEDFAIDIIVGKGPSANSIRLDLPKFTLIGATTRAGSLSAPLRDRFGVTLRLELYTPEELSQIVTRSAGILGVPIEAAGAMEIAMRSRGTPRIANRMLRRVRDFAEVRGNGTITKEMADRALVALEVDYLGLDQVDRRMLRAIIKEFVKSFGKICHEFTKKFVCFLKETAAHPLDRANAGAHMPWR